MTTKCKHGLTPDTCAYCLHMVKPKRLQGGPVLERDEERPISTWKPPYYSKATPALFPSGWWKGMP